MHDLIENCLWSSTVSQPKWREHGHLYKRSAAAEESKDQKVLTGRKLAIEQAVMTTSQHVGVASSIWTNKTRSFAAAWWLSNNSLANTVQRARCREWCWLVLEELHAGMWRWDSGEQQQGAWSHYCQTERRHVMILQKTSDYIQWHFGMFYATVKYFYNGHRNNVRVWLRLGNWDTWLRLDFTMGKGYGGVLGLGLRFRSIRDTN